MGGFNASIVLHCFPSYATTSIWRRMNNPAKNDVDAAKEMKKIRAEIEKLKKDHVQQMAEMRAEIARMKKGKKCYN